MATLMGIHDDTFYFDEPESWDTVDISTDGFDSSVTVARLIRGPKNKFLIFNEANEFDLRDLNIQQQSYSDYKMHIHFYKDTSLGKDFRPVMLYALKDDKKYVAVCRNDTEVIAEEVNDLQARIESSQDKALFYLVPVMPNIFKLKSSLFPDKILGFDQTDSNKLFLRTNDNENQYDRVEIDF